MKKFLAMLVFAALSVSGTTDNMIAEQSPHNGFYFSAPNIFHNHLNNNLSNRQVSSLTDEHKDMRKFFLYDSYTSESGTNDISSDDNNAPYTNGTFGKGKENVSFSGTDDKNLDNVSYVISDNEDYCNDLEKQLKNEEEILSEKDFVIKNEEILSDNNTGVEGEQKSNKNNLNNRTSIQLYYNKDYGAGRIQWQNRRYNLSNLSNKKIRQKLEELSPTNYSQDADLSDHSRIFNLSGFDENDSSERSIKRRDFRQRLIDQYFEYDTSSISK